MNNTIPTDKEALLQFAIERGIEIVFFYKGVDFAQRQKRNADRKEQGLRYVQPTQLFIHKNSKNMLLSAFQWGGITNTDTKAVGSTTKGGKPHWKSFRLDEMSNVQLRYKGNNEFDYFDVPSKKGATGNNVSSGFPVGNYTGQSNINALGGKALVYFDLNKAKVLRQQDKSLEEPKEPQEPNLQKEPEKPNQPKKQGLYTPDEIKKVQKIKQNLDSYEPIEESYSSGFFKWVQNLYGKTR